MNLKKFAQSAGLVSRRDSRMKVVQKGRKTLQIDFLGNELEKRQLLAQFCYSSGLLTIQTTYTNEQLSIISTSESGNYTMTSTGTWSGIPVSGLSNTSVDTYVNQSSCLVSNFLDHRRYTTVGNTDYLIGSSRVGLTGQKLAFTDRAIQIGTKDGKIE